VRTDDAAAGDALVAREALVFALHSAARKCFGAPQHEATQQLAQLLSAHVLDRGRRVPAAGVDDALLYMLQAGLRLQELDDSGKGWQLGKPSPRVADIVAAAASKAALQT
jgi:hypothetical protein